MAARSLSKSAFIDSFFAAMRQNFLLLGHMAITINLACSLGVWWLTSKVFAANMPSPMFVDEPLALQLSKGFFLVTSILFAVHYERLRGWKDPSVYGPVVAATFFNPFFQLSYDTGSAFIISVLTIVATLVWCRDAWVSRG